MYHRAPFALTNAHPINTILPKLTATSINSIRRPALGHSLNLLVALLASILSGFVIYANKLMPATLINKLEFE